MSVDSPETWRWLRVLAAGGFVAVEMARRRQILEAEAIRSVAITEGKATKFFLPTRS